MTQQSLSLSLGLILFTVSFILKPTFSKKTHQPTPTPHILSQTPIAAKFQFCMLLAPAPEEENISPDSFTKHPRALLMGRAMTRTWDINTLQLCCTARKHLFHKIKSNWNSQKSKCVFQRKPLECRGHEREDPVWAWGQKEPAAFLEKTKFLFE